MRIGLNARYLTVPYAGIGQYTLNLIKSLAEIDSENEYFLFVPWPVEYKFGPNFTIVDVRELKILGRDFAGRLLWEQYQLGRAIKRYKLDIYHSLYQTMPFGSQRIPSIVTIHDAIPWHFPFQREDLWYRWYSDISRWSCHKAQTVFAVSESAKADISLVYGLRPENIVVTYQTIGKKFSRSDSQLPGKRALLKRWGIDKPFLLYVGGFKRHKNLRFMLKAFAKAVHEYDLDLDLVIPGTIRSHSGIASHIYFDAAGLQRYAKDKKISQRVRMIGYVSQEELVVLYRAARAFISLSLYEGFGLPVLEAMASATPVIASNTYAYPEIVGDAGVLVHPYGANRIAQAIYDVMKDDQLRKTLIHRGKRRLVFFERAKIAREVLERYTQEYKKGRRRG